MLTVTKWEEEDKESEWLEAIIQMGNEVGIKAKEISDSPICFEIAF